MNEQQQSNRFIFSDDFYDQFDNQNDEQNQNNDINTQIEIPKIDNNPPVINEEIKEDKQFNINEELFKDEQKEEIPLEKSVIKERLDYFYNDNKEKEEPFEQTVSVDLLNNYEEPKFNDYINNDQNEETTKEEDNEKEIINPINNDFSYTSNNFNVETGINSELEKELIDTNTIYEPQQDEYYGYSKNIEPEVRNVYRARRNSNIQKPIWLSEDFNPSSEIPKIIDEKIMEQPKVINIDEMIEKEEKQEKIQELIDYEENNTMPVVNKSNLIEELKKKELETGKISILARYGDDFCEKDYITNPAIGRSEEIKQLNLILLTPEKSAILVGKPGIGKTSIVEGLAYQLQRDNVPNALKGYRIISVKTTSLLGDLPTGETRLQTLIDELKELDKIILFVDEIHMLMGATNESSLDFANMFKESLGRGNVKMIGATTTEEYERYILRDKAFVRRFQRVDVKEPTKEQTIKILLGTLPKIEKNTGAKLKYTKFVQTEIMSFIVDITSEYKRIYGIGSRYPDICLTLLSQAFSQAVFDNRDEVNIKDIRNAIANSKNIYPDVISKELVNFDKKFNELIKD